MKILFLDLKLGDAKILVETLEDLWHLENVLEVGDKISGQTMRTVEFGDKQEKKPVFITISLEDIEFSKSVNRLRLRGKILSGKPEDFVQIGRYHTIDVELKGKISINKKWKNYQIKRLKKAQKEGKKPLCRIVVMDEEKALGATLSGIGLDYGPEFRNRGSKRGDDYEKRTLEYFGEVLKYLNSAKEDEKLIVAGPAFSKENFKEFVKKKDPKFSKRIIIENCSYAEKSGFNELFKKGVFERIVGEQRLEIQEKLIEKFIAELNKGGDVVYGYESVEVAVNMSAVSTLMVLDEILRKDKKVQKLVEMAEKLKVELVVFEKDSDPGFKLKGFSGIAAILRFSIK